MNCSFISQRRSPLLSVINHSAITEVTLSINRVDKRVFLWLPWQEESFQRCTAGMFHLMGMFGSTQAQQQGQETIIIDRRYYTKTWNKNLSLDTLSHRHGDRYLATRLTRLNQLNCELQLNNGSFCAGSCSLSPTRVKSEHLPDPLWRLWQLEVSSVLFQELLVLH